MVVQLHSGQPCNDCLVLMYAQQLTSLLYVNSNANTPLSFSSPFAVDLPQCLGRTSEKAPTTTDNAMMLLLWKSIRHTVDEC